MKLPPLIGITLGDAAGIGPETIVKALPKISASQCSLFVIGDAEVLEEAAEQFCPTTEILKIQRIDQIAPHPAHCIQVLDQFHLDRKNFAFGAPHAGSGELAYQSICLGAQLALNKQIAALVTAPICKESLHLAGHPYDGHTGLLAHLSQTKEYRMTFSTKQLRIIHVTAHMALADACKAITEDRVFKTIQIGHQHLLNLGIKHPRIAVCGLNPHASEAGIFGNEDLAYVAPAIHRACALGWDVSGPEPGDAVFIQAFKGKYDMVVAQYHDQGHIPGKLMAFDTGVNVTLGLPFVRCSPDHGTAFDIAGKGMASENNLIEAIHYALLLLQ